MRPAAALLAAVGIVALTVLAALHDVGADAVVPVISALAGAGGGAFLSRPK